MVSKKKALWVRQGLKLATTKNCGIKILSDVMIVSNTAKSEVMSRLKSEPPACRRFFSWRRCEGFPMNQERLKELLHYCPETGQFTHLRGRKRVAAGTLSSRGYIQLWLDGKRYSAHRVAFLYLFGVWPDGPIDHVNGVRHDNRGDNLRVVTDSQNQQNKRLGKNNSSGHKGISWDKSRDKWCAAIYVESKCKHLGRFLCLNDAVAAYAQAAAKYHTHNPMAQA